MPWYKSGTVSVTQNSNAVIGTGAAFIANSRVGDAFRGPDGAWYEVTNIASDTALSISPNYQGATNAAGVYALAPMQGYVKDSADALRALVNTYGTKLAALGTTGNYDVLPVNKGGTGGTDQPSARTGLGLGTVSTENTVPVVKGGTGGTDQPSARAGLGLGNSSTHAVQTSSHDATSGSLLMPGAFGWGLYNGGLTQVTDANGTRPSGLYFATSGASNVPLAGDALLDVRNLSTQVIYQSLTYYINDRKFERSFVTSSWSAWSEVLTTKSFATAIAFNQVSSYSILKNLTGGVIAGGSVVAGSSLSFSDTADTAFGTPAGTWKSMSAVAAGYSSLFLRIS